MKKSNNKLNRRIRHSALTENLLSESSNLLLGLVDQMKKLKDLPGYKPALESKLLLTVVRDLEYYIDIENFIILQVRSKLPVKKFKHLLPNGRALMELFSDILFTSCADPNIAFKNCMLKDFIALADVINSDPSEVSKELIDLYSTSYDLYNILINNFSLPILRNPLEFNFDYRRKNQIHTVSVRSILSNEQWLENNCPSTIKVFPTAHKNMYRFYLSFSNHVHANNLTKEAYGREDFWLITKIFSITSLLLELIDHIYLNDQNKTRINNWRTLVHSHMAEFTVRWVNSPTFKS